MKTFISALGVLYVLPVLAFAQTVKGGALEGYINSLIGFVNKVIIPAILALAFLIFVWGIFKYFILSANNEDERKKGLGFMIYGLLGFVLMVSVVGIVSLLTNATGLDTSTTIPLPSIPGLR